jgi:predicted lipoprotein with Yx(FWY)xxD motif
VTIGSAQVGGFGRILVDGSGHTLYVLSTEKGGKITCTDDNGCTKIWPDTELPAGVTAATPGPGIDTSLLSTVKDAKGSLYVTYGGWPLYTFTGDTGPGQVKGEGITNFGGTWYVLDVAGQPVTGAGSTSSSSAGSTTTCTIPQNNGGDHDADNNGGPSDGDGCDV